MQRLIFYLENYVYQLSEKPIWTNTFGLARSLLAFSTLSTLLFNDIHSLFPQIKNISTFHLDSISEISIFFLLFNNLFLAKYICIGILIIVIIGWRPRISGILHWWVCFSFFIASPIVDGGDQVINILTFLLIPVCLTDTRKWHWQYSNKITSNTIDRLITLTAFTFLVAIRVQVAVIYFQASIAKFAVEEWRNGTALYYWFTHNTFGIVDVLKPIVLPLLQNSVIITLATWSVLVFELLLFAALFMDVRRRYVLLMLALLFHFSILIIHGLFSFFFAMSGALLLYLIPIGTTLNFRQMKNLKSCFFIKKYNT